MFKLIFHIFILIQIIPFSLSFRYRIYPTDIFQLCPPEFSVTTSNAADFVETENIELDDVDDVTLELNGNITFIRSFGLGQIGLRVITQYQSRGFWRDLPYRLETIDFCRRYLNPSEIWYNVVKHFTGDQKLCPPKQGVPLTFDHTQIGLILDSFGEYLEDGDYRAIVYFSHKFPEGLENVCFLFNAEIKLEYSAE